MKNLRASTSGSRLSEQQKRLVICPLCSAQPGKPCRSISAVRVITVNGKTIELKKSHDERKRMAMRKVDIERRNNLRKEGSR